MTLTTFRINDPEIQEWYNKQKNKSDVTRKALKKLYQEELQEKLDSQTKKSATIRWLNA